MTRDEAASETVTLDWLYARCIDVDGCLVWQLAGAHGTDPQARIGGRGGFILLVRRFLWEQVHERRFPKGHVARCSCGTDMCVHPDHTIAVTKSDSLRGRATSLIHRANLAAARRARSALSDEAVAQIRASDWTAQALANQHGIDPSYVRYIQRGLVRRDYTNPFMQLEAR